MSLEQTELLKHHSIGRLNLIWFIVLAKPNVETSAIHSSMEFNVPFNSNVTHVVSLNSLGINSIQVG
ncbi:MAG: hypothetical protein ACTS53_00330 [Candidatus Hodgkinia cicadicola]